MRAFLISAALIAGLLGVGVSPALAAKGVKKNNVNGMHHVHGVVTNVHHHKARTAAGHIGEITIKVQHHKKKGQPAVNGKKANGQTHTFAVVAGTQFTSVHGKQHRPSAFAAIRPGEHVSILAKGNLAESVAIHHHAKGKKQ